MSELYKEIPLLDLENNKNLKKEDILFLELNQIMEQINDLINNVDFNLEKNLEQHLEKFKNENNLDGLSEEEKIFEFIKFVDKQEYDYFNDLKKNFIQKIEIVLKNQDRIGSKLIDLIQSQEELEKKDLSNNWLKNQIKNVKKLFIESDFKNIEIYKFKNTNLDLITAKLNRLKYSINQINKEVNTIDFELIKKSLSNYNKAYTLDSFVKENPLFQKKFNYLNIKPYNEEFKEVLNKYKKEIEKIEKDIDLNVSKKFDLLSKRLTVNLTHEMIMKSLNKSILKPICLLKNNLKIPNKEDFKEIITGALVLVIAAQIGGTANHIIKNSDLNNIPYIEEVYKIATSEYDNMVSNGVDIMNSIKDNNVKFDENSILKIKQCVTNNSKTYEDITKFQNHMIYDSEIS